MATEAKSERPAILDYDWSKGKQNPVGSKLESDGGKVDTVETVDHAGADEHQAGDAAQPDVKQDTKETQAFKPTQKRP